MEFNSSLKGSFTTIRWKLSLGCKDASKHTNQEVWHAALLMKDKSNVIISIDGEKALDKI